MLRIIAAALMALMLGVASAATLTKKDGYGGSSYSAPTSGGAASASYGGGGGGASSSYDANSYSSSAGAAASDTSYGSAVAASSYGGGSAPSYGGGSGSYGASDSGYGGAPPSGGGGNSGDSYGNLYYYYYPVTNQSGGGQASSYGGGSYAGGNAYGAGNSYGAPPAPSNQYGGGAGGYGGGAGGYGGAGAGGGANNYYPMSAGAYNDPLGGLLSVISSVDINALILPALLIGGVALLLPAILNCDLELGTCIIPLPFQTGRRSRRDVDELTMQQMTIPQMIEHAYKIYDAVYESEQCMHRVVCELGGMLRNVRGKETFFSVLDQLASPTAKKQLFVLKRGAMSTLDDPPSCEAFKCGKLDNKVD